MENDSRLILFRFAHFHLLSTPNVLEKSFFLYSQKSLTAFQPSDRANGFDGLSSFKNPVFLRIT